MKLSTFWLIAGSILFLSLAAHARPEPEFINGHALGHAYLKDHWAQVHIDVENPSDEGGPMNAVLKVRDGTKSIQYVRPFYLPPQTKRVVWFSGQLGSNQENAVSILDDNAAERASGEELSNVLTANRLLFLRLDRDDVLPSLSMYIGQRKAYKEDPTDEGYDAPNRMMSPMEGVVRRTATLSTPLPSFPDQWAGLDSMGAVALGQLDYQDWRPSQVEALTTWIRSGGVLLLFPGESYDTLRESPLQKLLPVDIFASRQQKSVKLNDGSESWNVNLDEYVTVLESETMDGETVLSSDHSPMVVSRSMGLGRIYFFAFDGAVLDEWDSSGAFFARILRGRERLKPFAQTDLREKGPQLIDAVAGAQVAPRSFVVLTLGGFFFLSVISLAVAHYFRRTELAWTLIIPAGIILGFISYTVGQSYRTQVGQSINEVGVLTAGSNSPTAFRSAILGVHSEGRLQGELVADNAQSFLTAMPRGRGEGSNISTETVEVSPRYAIKNLDIQEGSFPRYIVNSPLKIDDGIRAEFQLGPNGLAGEITNNSPFDLENSLMAFNNYPFVLNGARSLPAGASVECELNAETTKSRSDFTTDALLGSASLTRKRTLKHLFSSPRTRSYNPWTTRLFLLGWPGGDFISEELKDEKNGQLTRRSSSVVCIEAQVEPAESGEKVVIPRAFSIPALRPGKSKRTFSISEYMGNNMPPQSGLVFYLPDFASNVELDRGELHMNVDAYGFELTVSGVDQSNGDEVQLARMKAPSGRKKIEIPEAERFQDKEMGALVLAVKTRPINDDGGSGQLDRAAGSSWRIDSLSARLNGTAR